MNMTKEDAIKFVEFFWNTAQADSFHPVIGMLLTDMCWGSGFGIGRARLRKVADSCGCKVAKAGSFSSAEVRCINQIPTCQLVRDITRERVAAVHRDVERNPNQRVFMKGWLRRIYELERYSLKYCNNNENS
jgi:lysozyme family protein